jgi:hypothetical protein
MTIDGKSRTEIPADAVVILFGELSSIAKGHWAWR